MRVLRMISGLALCLYYSVLYFLIIMFLESLSYHIKDFVVKKQDC